MRGSTTHARGHNAARLRDAHRGTNAEALGFVAGGEHDSPADDDRSAAQARIVALLDGRVERIEIGVQDRGGTGHEHMFASGPLPVYSDLRYASSRSASARGRLRAGRWPLSNSSGVMPRRSRTTARMNPAGKNRSLRHSRNRVGTSGHAASGHGFSNGVPDCARSPRRALRRRHRTRRRGRNPRPRRLRHRCRAPRGLPARAAPRSTLC